MLTPVKEAPESSTVTTGTIMMVILNFCPFFFAFVLWKYRGRLHLQRISTRISAMFFMMNPEKPYVGTYSVIFLLRRSFFVLITFTLWEHPSMQVELMLYSTLLYVCYIGCSNFHMTPIQRRFEIMNECILICICYHFVLFANPVWSADFREQLGISVVSFVGFLLAVNTLIIIWVNYQAICRKLYLNKLKKRAEKQKEEQI